MRRRTTQARSRDGHSRSAPSDGRWTRPGLPIMTCAADGVEQDASSVVGARCGGRRGRPLPGPGPRPAGRPAAGPGPSSASEPWDGGNGGATATAAVGIGCDRRAAAAQTGLGRHDRGVQAELARKAPPAPWRGPRASARRCVEQRPERDSLARPARGSSARRSVASSAASVILSTRRARISGSASTRPTAARVPTMRPHCGPPRSLSPEKSTRSAPAASPSATLGSPADARRQARAEAPGADVVDHPEAASGRARQVGQGGLLGEADDPVVAGWTRRSAAVSGPMARS